MLRDEEIGPLTKLCHHNLAANLTQFANPPSQAPIF
jgi:hypothetical protein